MYKSKDKPSIGAFPRVPPPPKSPQLLFSRKHYTVCSPPKINWRLSSIPILLSKISTSDKSLDTLCQKGPPIDLFFFFQDRTFFPNKVPILMRKSFREEAGFTLKEAFTNLSCHTFALGTRQAPESSPSLVRFVLVEALDSRGQAVLLGIVGPGGNN